MTTLTTNRILWVLTALAALVASLVGVMQPSIYDGLVDPAIMPGVFTQDLLVLVASIVLIVLAFVARAESYRVQIVIAGILGFFFYAYGIYAMEQVYTMWYYLYLLVLALSFYALIYQLSTFDYTAVALMELPPVVRIFCGAYAVFVAVMFNVIWIVRLYPLLVAGDRIENTFSIMVIDLVFIMPSMAIAGLLAIRRRPLGTVGVPALFVLGIGILTPLALGELLKPVLYDMPTIPGELRLYATLSLVFLALTVLYLATLRRPTRQLV
ncbi:MAG: hypothetical protein ACOC1U_05175 [Spirochaetota bacterium]